MPNPVGEYEKVDAIAIAKPGVKGVGASFYCLIAWLFVKKLLIVALYHILVFNITYHLITYGKMYSNPTPSLGLRFKMHVHCC